jgi:hypothetical protein
MSDRPKCRDLEPGMTIVWTNRPTPRDAAKRISVRKETDDGWWMTDGSGLADYVWDGGTAWQTLDALVDAAAEVARLREEVDAVTALCDEYAPLPGGHGMVPGSTLRAALATGAES